MKQHNTSLTNKIAEAAQKYQSLATQTDEAFNELQGLIGQLSEDGVEKSDGWITWNGGPQPIDDFVYVKVLCEDGGTGVGHAASFFWEQDKDGCDIVAYKVVE